MTMLAAVGVLLVADGGAPVGAAPAAVVVLGTDAPQAALFNATGMSPGKPLSRCLRVEPADPASQVRFWATATGALAKGLRLQVDEGVGGSSGDCADFAGRTVFDGSLHQFAVEHRDFGSGLARDPRSTGYRLTVEVLDDQAWQGLGATADFVWEAQDAPVTTSGDVPGGPSPTSVPVAAPRGGGPGPAGTAADGAVTGGDVPSDTGAPSPGRLELTPLRPFPGGASGPAPDGFLDRARTVLLGTARAAGRAAGLPVGLLGLVVAFLCVQNRIDRSDPKLRLSPLHTQETLLFGPPGSPAGAT